MLFTVIDPQFGTTIVHAAKFDDVQDIYATYLQSINATSTGSRASYNQAAAGNAPIGAHLITKFNNKGSLVGKIGPANSPLSFAKVNNLAGMTSEAFFSNLYVPPGAGQSSAPPIDYGQQRLDISGHIPTTDGTDTSAPTEAFSWRPGFEAGLRQAGIGPFGVRGALANQAFDPLLARATMHAAFNPLQDDFVPGATQKELLATPGRTFREYLGSQAAGDSLFGRGGAQAARELFEQARTLSGDPVKALAALGEGGGISGRFLTPATIGQGAVLANVAREGGQQRYGSFARFLPSGEDLAQTYLSYAPENQAIDTRDSFADFLQKRIYGGAGVANMSYG